MLKFEQNASQLRAVSYIKIIKSQSNITYLEMQHLPGLAKRDPTTATVM